MAGWQPFFAAEVGASSALAGLIFVGVSINLSTIMKYRGLPNRALEGLLALVLILLVASLMLIPGQEQRIQGSEVTVLGFIGWFSLSVMYFRELPHLEAKYRRASIPGLMLAQLAMLLFLAAGTLLFAVGNAGLYVLVAAVLCAFLLAFFDAWVLLIEINR